MNKMTDKECTRVCNWSNVRGGNSSILNHLNIYHDKRGNIFWVLELWLHSWHDISFSSYTCNSSQVTNLPFLFNKYAPTDVTQCISI